MLCGRRVVSIDEKWRLTIPVGLRKEFGGIVLLREGGNGCVQICKPPAVISSRYAPCVALAAFDRKPEANRITIPQDFRLSVSFYFGRKAILVGRGTYLELWPCP